MHLFSNYLQVEQHLYSADLTRKTIVFSEGMVFYAHTIYQNYE